MDFECNWKKVELAIDGIKQLFNNSFLADLTFEFPDGRVIFGHRTIISMRSRVAHEYFNGKILLDYLIVDDYSYEVFIEFLRFLYNDECSITSLNVGELLCVAMDYLIDELTNECVRFLLSSNPLQLLEMCIKYNWNNIYIKTLEYISSNFNEIASSTHFLHIQPEILQLILNTDHLSVSSEYDVFDVVMKWTRQVCDNQKEHDNGIIKRKFLGDILYLIRFAAMSFDEFSKCIEREPDLLTSDETCAIFLHITIKKYNEYKFSDVKRRIDDIETDTNNVNNVEKKVQEKYDTIKNSVKSNENSIEYNFEIQSRDQRKCDKIRKSSNNNNSVTIIPSKLSSISLDYEPDEEHVLIDIEKCYLVFSVTKPILISGLLFYGESAIVKFRIERKGCPDSIQSFESNENEAIILFDPTLIQPNILHRIVYTFKENAILSFMKCNKQVPWQLEQNGIIFKFFKMSLHIGSLYFQPDKNCLSSKNNSSMGGGTVITENKTESYNRKKLVYRNKLRIPTRQINEITNQLIFRIEFIVSRPITLKYILMYSKPTREVHIRVIKKKYKEEVLFKKGTTNCITILPPTILQARQRYEICYKFDKLNNHNERLTSEWAVKVPWKITIDDAHFTFFQQSHHIKTICYD